MWLLLTGGLRRWIIASVALPLGARALGAAGRRLERAQGPSTLSRGLQSAGAMVTSSRHHRRRRGLLRRLLHR